MYECGTWRRRLPAAVVVLTCLAAASGAAADWSTGTGGNSARDGRGVAPGPTQPELRWTGGTNSIQALPPVILGDLVVTTRVVGEGPDASWIVGQDLVSGAVLWQVRLPIAFPMDFWRSKVSAARDGFVYATRAGSSKEDHLYALDPADGDIVWTSETLIDESSSESLAFAPDGDLIVGNILSLVRIDGATGETVWSSNRYCPSTHGCAATVFGHAVYVWQPGPGGPVVSRYDVETGAFQYSSEVLVPGFVNQVSLMVGPDGTVYAPRTENDPETDALVALTDTGSAFVEKWRIPLGFTAYASFGIGPDGFVYTYSTAGRVLRIDPADGTITHRSEVIQSDVFAPRIAVDALGRLFVTNGSFDGGELFAFNPDLSLRWSEPIPGVFIGGPALADDGTLVVAGVGTDVRAYRTVFCGPDLDGDTSVGFGDLTIMLSEWGPCDVSCPADLTGDGDVDIADLIALFAAWGAC